MTAMNDEQLDQAISRYLDWRARQVQGAPDAQAMAMRVTDTPWTPRPRWQWAIATLATMGLLLLLAVAVLLVAGAPRPAPGPLANGPIVVANAAGWRAIDLSSGAEAPVEPCGGLCPEAFRPVVSAGGRIVSYIVPTPFGGDGRTPTAPGWSLWQWDREAGTTSRAYLCDMCVIDHFVVSPDGRSIAVIETREAHPSAALDVVVVDTATGREIRRFADIGPMPTARMPTPTGPLAPLVPAWDAQGRLLLARMSGDRAIRQRIDLATGDTEEVGRGLPAGLLQNSPDGSRMTIATLERPYMELLEVDPDLEETRPILSSDGTEWIDAAWAPDGTAIALMTGTMPADAANFVYEIQIVDLATGEVTRHPTQSVEGKLLWLPAD
jgi:hypothetical protein